METARINVPLAKREVVALVRMAEAECRQPREQLRYLLCEEARRRGLLPGEQYVEQQEETNGKTSVTGQ